jgi:2-hydroxy-6-oxonona-2,4-dienedioate hydrolase
LWAAMILMGLCGLNSMSAESATPSGSIDGHQAKFIDVAGLNTRYYDAGAGEPVLLVHGGPWEGTSSANDWSRNLSGLAREFRVVAVDRLGTGMTDNPDRARETDFNEMGQIRHLIAFIEALGAGPVNLVGHGEGGIVLYLAMQRPDLVKSLVLVSSDKASPDVAEDQRAESLAGCPWEVYGEEIGPWMDELVCRYRSLSYDDSHVTEEFIDAARMMNSQPKVQWTRFYRDGGAGEPFRSEFDAWRLSMLARIRDKGELRMPVLLILARDDPTYPLERSMALYDVIAEHNASIQTLILNDAGHFSFREKPEEFNFGVTRFIKTWIAVGEIDASD